VAVRSRGRPEMASFLLGKEEEIAERESGKQGG
jgi:hypothetical protein